MHQLSLEYPTMWICCPQIYIYRNELQDRLSCGTVIKEPVNDLYDFNFLSVVVLRKATLLSISRH